MNAILLFFRRPIVTAVLHLLWISLTFIGMFLVIVPTVIMIGLILEAIGVIPAGTIPRIPAGDDPLVIP